MTDIFEKLRPTDLLSEYKVRVMLAVRIVDDVKDQELKEIAFGHVIEDLLARMYQEEKN